MAHSLDPWDVPEIKAMPLFDDLAEGLRVATIIMRWKYGRASHKERAGMRRLMRRALNMILLGSDDRTVQTLLFAVTSILRSATVDVRAGYEPLAAARKHLRKLGKQRLEFEDVRTDRPQRRLLHRALLDDQEAMQHLAKAVEALSAGGRGSRSTCRSHVHQAAVRVGLQAAETDAAVNTNTATRSGLEPRGAASVRRAVKRGARTAVDSAPD